jgi:TolB-like protein
VTRVDAPALPTDRQSGNGAGSPLAEESEPREAVALGRSRVAPPVARQRSRKRLESAVLAALAGILCLLVAAATITNWHLPWSTGASSVPRPSIVVLPFSNLSKDPDQQYFADGVTEDLTSDLSRMAGALVISADTALTYRNKRESVKQIGRELGVRYVVEGSVERVGDQVRVNTQLIDAGSDTHLWAERFDREISNIFALQSEITGRIAFMLNLELIVAEADRPSVQMLWTTFFAVGNAFSGGRRPAKIIRTPSTYMSRRSESIRNSPRRKPFWPAHW